MMHRLVALLALAGLFASSSATQFVDCGSLASDVSLIVEGCDIPPCILHRGEGYNVNFIFTSSVDTETLTLGATASIGGIQVPWPGVDKNACNQLTDTETPCPIAAGTVVSWTMIAEVLSEYPKLSTLVTFKLIDSDGNSQTCANVPATIQ